MTTSVDISRMDKNSFHVDDELQVSIPNPPNRNWMIERRKDVPIVNEHGLQLIKFGEEMDDFSLSSVDVLALRLREGIKIELTKDSKIDGISFSLNLYKDEDFREGLINMMSKGMDMAAEETGMGDLLGSFMMARIGQGLDLVSNKIDKYIEEATPVSKTVYSGIYVIPLSHETISNTDPMFKVFGTNNPSWLSRASTTMD